MIEVSNIFVTGWGAAIRGMRNPMNSWDRSDTVYGEICNGEVYEYKVPQIGYNDIHLMKKLCNAGHPHRKFLRMIVVTMDINAPLYWWKEYDTYKVGTVANSCSTMHKIHAKEFTLDDFSHERLSDRGLACLQMLIDQLNTARRFYNCVDEHERKEYWWDMIQLLTTSYNQKRTVQFNYETVFNILDYRQNHKLYEWNILCDILLTLPYVKDLYLKEDSDERK